MAGPPQWKEPVGFDRLAKRRSLRAVGKRGRERRTAMLAIPLAGPCEAGIPDVCTGRAEHRHHIRRSSQGGTHDRSNIRLLCHACHHWVHSNPAEARERGLLVFGIDNWEQP